VVAAEVLLVVAVVQVVVTVAFLLRKTLIQEVEVVLLEIQEQTLVHFLVVEVDV
jgi:hypothetical protein